jgi:ribosomal protein S18 acetylase RimI-like enzyme
VWYGGLLDRKTWAILRRSLDMLGEMSKEHPMDVHYYLEYIGVMPGCQGQGIGTCLCQALLHKADQEHVGCYLETANPRTIPLYQRLGFRMLREREILAVRMWFMWRDPKEASAPAVIG